MTPVPISRDPVTIIVDQEKWHFYCRLFADEDHARQIFNQLVEQGEGGVTSSLLIREFEHSMTWGILAFSSSRIDILTLAPFIADHGEPYYSVFMTEAVMRRKAVLASHEDGSGYPPDLLSRLRPIKLL